MRIQGESWPGYHDKVIRVAGLIADITEQVESRSKTEELNQFLKQRIAEIAGNGSRQEASYRCASDDLRNKACRINDQARLLLRGYGTMLGESGTAILSSLVENGQWIVHLVDTISLYTGIARHQLWLQQVDLSRFAEETALELSGSQSMQSIDLMIDKNILAWADAGLMKHAMKSLFSLVWKPETRRIEFTSVSEGGKTRFCFQARRDSPALIDKNELCVALFEQIIRRHGGTVEISQGPEQLLAVTFTLGTRRS
jgi:light-regulated signal transduction histidine kinase (bacteriophytochrome)